MALTAPQSKNTVYDNLTGSTYRWGRGPKYEEWANTFPHPPNAPTVVQRLLEGGFLQRFSHHVGKLPDNPEGEREAVRRASVYAHGLNLGLQERGLLAYRFRLSRVDQGYLKQYADDLAAGKTDMLNTLGEIDDILTAHAKRQAKKLGKKDGRAGRDADGDGLVNERERPTAATLRPAAPRPHNRLGERPTNLVAAPAATAAGLGVAAAAGAIARALTHSSSKAARVAGVGVGAGGALVGAATVGVGGLAVAHDIAYQRRMEAVGQKFNFKPMTRGERFKCDLVQTRKDLRSERANYDRPIDAKPIGELGLPDYKAAQGFAKATQKGRSSRSASSGARASSLTRTARRRRPIGPSSIPGSSRAA
jgi:hypothetical protein